MPNATGTHHRHHLSRRTVLRMIGASGAVAVAGCNGLSSTTDSADVRGLPDEALIDETLDVTVGDLPVSSTIRVAAEATDHDGERWDSHATFETGDDGVISLAADAPVAGTYRGSDPMGLFWSMSPEKLRAEHLFRPANAYDVRLRVEDDETTIAERETTRLVRTRGVETVQPPEDSRLVGEVALPAEGTESPGVVLLHGSEGEPLDALAGLLASRGYAVFAVQYFGDPDPLPDRLVEVPLEYIAEAIEWLQSHPSVLDGPVGIVGGSRGGELALLVGSEFDGVGAVVGYSPSGVVVQGAVSDEAAWTKDGEPLPFADFGTVVSGGLENVLEQEYMIPVEEIDGPVLLVTGEADQLWPATTLSEFVIRRLDSHNHSHQYDHLSYENAGHLVQLPHLPTPGTDLVWHHGGRRLELGGTPEANAEMAADSWPIVLDYLERLP